MAASRLLGATRCAALPAVGRRAITVVSRGPWSFEFEAKGAVLHAQYGLPPKLPCPQEAIAEWSGPIADEVRRGPTELMGSSSERTLRNAACVLRFLDDVQSAAAGLARQERPMEALVLRRWILPSPRVSCCTGPAGVSGITTNWRVMSGQGSELVRIQAARSLRDRAPAVGAVVAGLAGPLAWIPGVMVVNEVIMKRTDQYGALPKSGGPSGFDLGKAVMRHHILRMLYDAPRVVDVEKFYNVKDGLSLVELQASIDDGTLDECVTGRFEP
ncbi:unnamed protein product [Prorocentrum cordatum]|uniref:Uncharacterized protein n=1 Tax=Prorocentrum cordatum TaxID=2364126 RepID=A0ABN9X6Y9_9DINO|nr:unnamed protein product [Polarella glacialis]